MTCPKCSGAMEQGATRAERAGKQVWHKGTRHQHARIGLFPPRFEPAPETYDIVVHRCTSCGFLEAYAPVPK